MVQNDQIFTYGEYSNIIHPWLQVFITLVGGDSPDKIASYLLEDSGIFPSKYYNSTQCIQQYEYTYKYGSKIW